MANPLAREIKELLRIRKKKMLLEEEETTVLERIHTILVAETEGTPSVSVGKNQPKSKAEAYREILRQADTPLHLEEILRRVRESFGIVISKTAASATLRKYAATGRDFKAFGGNKFGLLEKEYSE